MEEATPSLLRVMRSPVLSQWAGYAGKNQQAVLFCTVAASGRWHIRGELGAPASFSADLCDCSALAQLTCEEVAELFLGALDRAGATVVQSVSHAFPETGLTCVLILRESHGVLHTWPETGTINIDIFSCTTRLRCMQAITELARSFGARKVSIREMSRADGHRPRGA